MTAGEEHHSKFNSQCIFTSGKASHPSLGQICSRCEVLSCTGAVVGQVHSKDHCHDHHGDEA